MKTYVVEITSNISHDKRRYFTTSRNCVKLAYELGRKESGEVVQVSTIGYDAEGDPYAKTPVSCAHWDSNKHEYVRY